MAPGEGAPGSGGARARSRGSRAWVPRSGGGGPEAGAAGARLPRPSRPLPPARRLLNLARAAALSFPEVRVLPLHGSPREAATPRSGAGPGPRRHPGGTRKVALPAGATAQPAPGSPARVSRSPRWGWPRDGPGARGTKSRREADGTGRREGPGALGVDGGRWGDLQGMSAGEAL